MKHMYDDNNTIRELLNDDLIADYLDLVYPKSFVELVPEKYRDLPLKELPELVSMPWGAPYIALPILNAVECLYELKYSENIQCIPLWKKADKLALAYAFTGDADSADCFANLVGNHTEQIDDLVVFNHLDRNYPRCFIWACLDNPVVDIANSTKMADALKKNGVPYRLELYPNGGHGMGVARGTAAEGWLEEMITFFKD